MLTPGMATNHVAIFGHIDGTQFIATLVETR